MTTTDRRTENASEAFDKSLFTGKLVWRFTYQKHFSNNQKQAINISYTHIPQNVPCPANFHVTIQKMYNICIGKLIIDLVFTRIGEWILKLRLFSEKNTQ